MNEGRIIAGLALLGAAGWGLLQLLPKSSSITLAQAEQLAMSHATEFVDVQRQAGFFVNIVGVLYRRTFTGKPPFMPQVNWDSILQDLEGRTQTLHYIQVTIQYVPAGAGGGENLIYMFEQASGGLLLLAQTNEALINWF